MTFRILARQMRALGRQTQGAFLARVESYLREHLPEHVAKVGSERLPGWLAGALALAHAHGIHTEPEAFQLMMLLTVLGLDADRKHPWLAAALEDRALLPEGKITCIVVEGCARVEGLEERLVISRYRLALERARRQAPTEVSA